MVLHCLHPADSVHHQSIDPHFYQYTHTASFSTWQLHESLLMQSDIISTCYMTAHYYLSLVSLRAKSVTLALLSIFPHFWYNHIEKLRTWSLPLPIEWLWDFLINSCLVTTNQQYRRKLATYPSQRKVLRYCGILDENVLHSFQNCSTYSPRDNINILRPPNHLHEFGIQ